MYLYGQVDPSLVKWKKKSFPLYDSLAKLCGDIIATGSNAFRGGTVPGSEKSSDETPDATEVGMDGGYEKEFSDIEVSASLLFMLFFLWLVT